MDLKELTYYTKILIYICIGAYGWWMILIYICIGAYGWMNRPIRVDFATIGWKSSILNFDLVSSIGAIELKFWGGPNSSGPSKLPLCKHDHAFSSFLNSLLLLKYNLGPSNVKFGTFWWQIWDLLGGPRTPLVPFLVALMVSSINRD